MSIRTTPKVKGIQTAMTHFNIPSKLISIPPKPPASALPNSEPRGVVGSAPVYHESDPCSTPVSGAGFRDVKISAHKVFRC